MTPWEILMTTPIDDERNDPILDRTRALPASIEPAGDLWPAINRGLQAPTESRWATARLATAAVLLICVSSTLTLWVAGWLEAPVSGEIATAPPVVPFGSWFAGGTDIALARTQMYRSVEELALLSPETRDVVNANLGGIEIARRDINSALQEHPNDALLQQLLLSSYTNEIKILSDIGGMTRSVAY